MLVSETAHCTVTVTAAFSGKALQLVMKFSQVPSILPPLIYLTSSRLIEPKADRRACCASCRGMLRGREDALLKEGEDWQERASQSRQVRQRQNPEEPSDLTSIRELVDEVTQDTHEGELHGQ